VKLTAAQIAYATARAGKPRPQRSGLRRMESHRLMFHLDGPELFLPIYVLPQNINGDRHTKKAEAKAQRTMVWSCLTTQLRTLDRACIRALTFTRHSPGQGVDEHDGIQPAFKYICDAVCAWIVEGPRVWEPRVLRRVGHYDGMLITNELGGIECHYEQQKHESHGISIKLTLGE
jgi:hypothetical protein